MTPFLAVSILLILGAFFLGIRPGTPLRAVAVLFAALADTVDLIPHFLMENGRGLRDMGRYLCRQIVHYHKSSSEAAR